MLKQTSPQLGLIFVLKIYKTAQSRFSEFCGDEQAEKALWSSQWRRHAAALCRQHLLTKLSVQKCLEHIPDYQAVLKEIERVLKPGGLFLRQRTAKLEPENLLGIERRLPRS